MTFLRVLPFKSPTLDFRHPVTVIQLLSKINGTKPEL